MSCNLPDLALNPFLSLPNVFLSEPSQRETKLKVAHSDCVWQTETTLSYSEETVIAPHKQKPYNRGNNKAIKAAREAEGQHPVHLLQPTVILLHYFIQKSVLWANYSSK